MRRAPCLRRKGAGLSEDLTPEARAARVWAAPSASVASRRPAKKSRGSFRGALVNPRTNREIVFESTLERDLAYILPTLPTVVGVRDQVGPVEYVDEDGVVHQHTFDFVADHEDGTSTAIAVKPARRVERSGVQKTLDLIRDQRTDVADRFVVRTGDHITRDRAANACQRRSDSRPSWRSKSRPLALGSGGYGEGPDRGPRHIALSGLIRG